MPRTWLSCMSESSRDSTSGPRECNGTQSGKTLRFPPWTKRCSLFRVPRMESETISRRATSSRRPRLAAVCSAGEDRVGSDHQASIGITVGTDMAAPSPWPPHCRRWGRPARQCVPQPATSAAWRRTLRPAFRSFRTFSVFRRLTGKAPKAVQGHLPEGTSHERLSSSRQAGAAWLCADLYGKFAL